MRARLAPALLILAGAAPAAPGGAGSGGCIALRADEAPAVVDAGTLIYREGARRGWLVHPDGACRPFARDTVVIAQPAGGRLCRGDLFRTVSRTDPVPSPTCRFGAFAPAP